MATKARPVSGAGALVGSDVPPVLNYKAGRKGVNPQCAQGRFQLLLFRCRAVLSMGAYHLFPWHVLAVISLIKWCGHASREMGAMGRACSHCLVTRPWAVAVTLKEVEVVPRAFGGAHVCAPMGVRATGSTQLQGLPHWGPLR